MKINRINFEYKAELNKENSPKKKKQEQKQIDKSANELTGVYNIAFCGLFKKKNNEPQIPDLRNLWSECTLQRGQKYKISENSRFMLSNYYIDLGSKDIKPVIKGLKKKKEIIIGRLAYNPYGNMTSDVSGNHLKISRDKSGQLIAEDLNSTNGTKILPTICTFNENSRPFQLQPGLQYVMPYKSVILFGGNELCLKDIKSYMEKFQDGESIIIGSGKKCDIRYKDSNASDEHLKITKYGNKVLVEDLHSDWGTDFIGIKCSYNDDYAYLNERAYIRPNVPTRIPNDSQIYLGKDLTIDLRNKNFLNPLNTYGQITIGRKSDNNFVVSPFYNQVSGHHLIIQKEDEDIIVTDIGSTNGTEIIPRNRIQPFYGDLGNLNLQQGNIGDCYLLSTIYALSRTPRGQQYIRNLVRVGNNGTYGVKFYNSPEIFVPLEQLDGQINEKGETKYSVSGDLGIKAIERAYGKMLKEESYKLAFDAAPEQTLFGKIDDGGKVVNAIKKLTGLDADSVYLEMTDADRVLYSCTVKGLNNQILACSTPKYGKYNGYVDPNRIFNQNHAYGIKYIDSYRRRIGIVNPHNTKNTYDISWDEFKKYFDFLYTATF